MRERDRDRISGSRWKRWWRGRHQHAWRVLPATIRAQLVKLGAGSSFECLILAEISDRESEWIYGDELVGDLALKDKDKVGGIEDTLNLAVVRGRVIDHVKIHACLIRWCLHVFQSDLLHVDVDLRCRRIRDELADDVVLAVGVQNAIGELAVEEVESFRKIVLDRVAIPLVVEGTELSEEILRFGVLGFVFEVVVVNRLGPPKVINSNHQRPEVLERADRPQINQRQRDANNREQREGNLQIGVRHHRVTVLFEIEPFGIVEAGIVLHAKKSWRIWAEDPPDVPLKM